jgi:SAM-dependent methyltransferase
MRIFILPNGDSAGKFRGMVHAFPDAWQGRVLDVGCRSGRLQDALAERDVAYCGLDLNPPATVVGDLNGGLPFGAASNDTVVALDVLEHTDDIHGSFSELCRVARRHVLVVMPNLYQLGYRVSFLMGRQPSGKYGLSADPPADRHRWLFSFREAKDFTHIMGARCGFSVVAEGCLVGPRRSLAGVRHLVRLFPNLLSPCYAALLQRGGPLAHAN